MSRRQSRFVNSGEVTTISSPGSLAINPAVSYAVSNNELRVQPIYNGYQLLGDSVFVRFASQILRQQYDFVDGTCQLGYCVSGQRIHQLACKIKKNTYHLIDKVVMLIGTNDVLCGRSLPDMIKDYKNLMALLYARGVSKIFILTLPPIPKLALTQRHWEVIRAFNEFLKTSMPNDKVSTIDILPCFIKQHVPAIMNPPSKPSFISENNNGHFKRKSHFDVETMETPKKKKKMLSPEMINEDDSKLSGFGRYLNRVNRLQNAEDNVSSEEESSYTIKLMPSIDRSFLKNIQNSITPVTDQEKNEPYWLQYVKYSGASKDASSPKEADKDDLMFLYKNSVTESLVLKPSQYNSPLNKNESDKKNEGDIQFFCTLPSLHKEIFENTYKFLNLNCYEPFLGPPTQRRLDLVHPNLSGLRCIRDSLIPHLFGQ